MAQAMEEAHAQGLIHVPVRCTCLHRRDDNRSAPVIVTRTCCNDPDSLGDARMMDLKSSEQLEPSCVRRSQADDVQPKE
jgi:hypothetical protein